MGIPLIPPSESKMILACALSLVAVISSSARIQYSAPVEVCCSSCPVKFSQHAGLERCRHRCRLLVWSPRSSKTQADTRQISSTSKTFGFPLNAINLVSDPIRRKAPVSDRKKIPTIPTSAISPRAKLWEEDRRRNRGYTGAFSIWAGAHASPITYAHLISLLSCFSS